MKRVLIVTPHFPPVNAPDHQRVRMAIPHLAEFGWEPHILCVDPKDVPGNKDSLLERSLPSGLKVTMVTAVPEKLTRQAGFGGLAYRAFHSLYRAGAHLLKKQTFDLVFFSTTCFPVLALGPLWQKQFQIPYVLDFQDPWRNDYYGRPGAPSPPGGRFKYGFAAATATLLEPWTVKKANAIIAVSPGYLENLKNRYNLMNRCVLSTLPFAYAPEDFEMAQTVTADFSVQGRWLYMGAAGERLYPALRILFSAVARAKEEVSDSKVPRLSFIGTSYAANGRARPSITPLAREYGLEDVVEEVPDRVSYFQSLRLMKEAAGNLLLGCDDPAYTPSKVYPMVGADRPIVAILHRECPLLSSLKESPLLHISTFPDEQEGQEHQSIVEFLFAACNAQNMALQYVDVQSFHAKTMTKILCGVFDKVLSTDLQLKVHN